MSRAVLSLFAAAAQACNLDAHGVLRCNETPAAGQHLMVAPLDAQPEKLFFSAEGRLCEDIRCTACASAGRVPQFELLHLRRVAFWLVPCGSAPPIAVEVTSPGQRSVVWQLVGLASTVLACLEVFSRIVKRRSFGEPSSPRSPRHCSLATAPEVTAAVAELRALVKAQSKWPEPAGLAARRFLRARKGDVEAAAAAWSQYCAWHEEERVGHAASEVRPPRRLPRSCHVRVSCTARWRCSGGCTRCAAAKSPRVGLQPRRSS